MESKNSSSPSFLLIENNLKTKIKIELQNLSHNLNTMADDLQSLRDFMLRTPPIKKQKNTFKHSFLSKKHKKINKISSENIPSDIFNEPSDKNSINEEEDKSLLLEKKNKKKNEVATKLYTVKAMKDGVIQHGFRIFCKCQGISCCFGPYSDYNYAFEIRKLMHYQLKSFSWDVPDVKEKIKEFYERITGVVDTLRTPLEMIRRNKSK